MPLIRHALSLSFAGFLGLLGPRPLLGDVVLEETHGLAAGWNLIHIALDPLEKDARIALQTVDWESLWTWLPDTARAAEPGRGGRWLSLHRDAPVFLSTLATFSGPASYAILATSAGTLRVRGVLRPDRQPLRGEIPQLFGPSMRAASPPSVAAYFSRPGILASLGDVHELGPAGYRRMAATDSLREGRAYWLRPSRDVPDPHPIQVGAGFGGLEFSPQSTLQEIELDLGAPTGGGAGGGLGLRELRLLAIPSAGGAAPTDWLELEKPDGSFAPITTETAVAAPEDATRMRLAFRARQPGAAPAGSTQRALAIEISTPSGKALVGADLELTTLRGFWTGEAVLAEVERPEFHGGGFAPAPSLPVSLILEFPGAGSPRLLSCVEVKADRDARKLRHRLIAALFPEPVTLAGNVAADGKSGTLRGSLSLDRAHPLNPYRHRYHPEHSLGVELTRSITITLSAQEPPGLAANPFAAAGVLTGTYEEEIHGLSLQPIRVRGAFRLHGLATPGATICGEGE